MILDLCVSAALDSVKERVEVPWRQMKTASETVTLNAAEAPPTASAVDTSPEDLTKSESQPVVEPLIEAASSPVASTSSPAPATETTSVPSSETSPVDSEAQAVESSEPAIPPRMLHRRNFLVALKEITPSSSETLGTLADLRKWNEEFGEGRKDKRHKSVWGKGKFGFIPRPVDGQDEVKVAESIMNGMKSESVPDSRA